MFNYMTYSALIYIGIEISIVVNAKLQEEENVYSVNDRSKETFRGLSDSEEKTRADAYLLDNDFSYISNTSNKLTQETYKVFLTCSKGSDLKYIRGEKVQKLDYRCNQFVSGYQNISYTFHIGNQDYLLNLTVHYTRIAFDGYKFYFETSPLEGTICGSGTYYHINNFVRNQVGSCRSKKGLTYTESEIAYTVIYGGKCEAGCYGLATGQFCPGVH